MYTVLWDLSWLGFRSHHKLAPGTVVRNPLKLCSRTVVASPKVLDKMVLYKMELYSRKQMFNHTSVLFCGEVA